MIPKVSVISSVYEQHLTLTAHLNSLAHQTYEGPWELLICDDGSSSNMLSTVKSIHSLDVRYVWQPDKGFRLSRSRNNALRLATGELVIFLDGDVIVTEDFISKHVASHGGGPSISLGSRKRVLVKQNERTHPCPIIESDIIDNLGDSYPKAEADFKAYIMYSPTPWAASMGCNFSIYPKANVLFDERFVGWGFEDWEFVFRLFSEKQYRIQYVAAEVRHIEWGGQDELGLPRPKTHQEIVLLIKNLIYFLDRHPHVDAFPLKRTLLHYRLDIASNRWCRNHESAQGYGDLDKVLTLARDWFELNEIGNSLTGHVES